MTSESRVSNARRNQSSAAGRKETVARRLSEATVLLRWHISRVENGHTMATAEKLPCPVHALPVQREHFGGL